MTLSLLFLNDNGDDDVVDYGDDDDVVDDDDDDLYIMPTQGLCVCPFVCLFGTKASRNGQI